MFWDLFVDSADNSQFLAFKLRIAIDKNSNSSFQLFICKFSNRQNSESTYILRNPLTFAGSACKFCGLYLHLRFPLTFCWIQLQLLHPGQLAIFACCGVPDTTNVPKKLTLQKFVRGIHGSLVSGIHWHFGLYLKVCLWNPGTYRHKISRLSSAQFGLVV